MIYVLLEKTNEKNLKPKIPKPLNKKIFNFLTKMENLQKNLTTTRFIKLPKPPSRSLACQILETSPRTEISHFRPHHTIPCTRIVWKIAKSPITLLTTREETVKEIL